MGGNGTNGTGARAQFQIYSYGATGPFRWRLLGGNNRDLGRGIADYPDAETCRIGVKEMQAGLDRLTVSLVRMGENRWAWRLLDGPEPLVASAHAFDRRIRCTHASELFRSLAGTADIRAGVLVSGWRGPRPSLPVAASAEGAP